MELADFLSRRGRRVNEDIVHPAAKCHADVFNIAVDVSPFVDEFSHHQMADTVFVHLIVQLWLFAFDGREHRMIG